MPICYVNTNLPSSPMLENFATSFAEEIAKILKKPMERIRVVIESGQHLVVAGNADPAVLIRIYSIGVFDHNRNPGYTDHLVPFVSNALDVPPPRVSFLYLPIDSSMIGSGK